LQGKKSNYSEIGGAFDVEWKDGLFRRIIGPAGFDKMAAEAKADDVFMALLKRLTRKGGMQELSTDQATPPRCSKASRTVRA
jgi:hypothetical protein